MARDHHDVVVVGGGTAGITVAARLRKAGVQDVAVVEPSATHYYQPLWTLVGGGRAAVERSARPTSRVVPRGVRWVRDAVVAVDPDARVVRLRDGEELGYRWLVMAAGIQLDWDSLPGLPEALCHDGVASNYGYGLSTAMWDYVRHFQGGTAIFSMPVGPIKCAGAPQKIAYLAADYWRRRGVLDDIRKILVLPTPGMFGVPEWSRVLEDVAAGYGFEVRLQSELTEVDPTTRQAVITEHASGTKERLGYDLMHVTPPQSAPDWVKASPLADPASPFGYVEVDRHTLRHPRYPEVFGLGDVTNTPNSKTGAAVRKQAPVLVANLVAAMNGRPAPKSYDGYASCPITTSRSRLLLCEFDYDAQPTPSLPLLNTMKQIPDRNLFKRVGLPMLYWNLMLKGLA